MVNVTHWTERSTEDFLYSIASDFIEQLRERMDALPMNQSELARAARVTKGYVSGMFKNPGNLSLVTMIRFARIVGMKLSIVGYEDTNDPDNTRGPISADVFLKLWKDAGQPADMWAFKVKEAKQTGPVLDLTYKRDGFVWLVEAKSTSSGTLETETSNKVMARLPHHYINRGSIQKVDRLISKNLQDAEVQVNG